MEIRHMALFPFDKNNRPRTDYETEVDNLLRSMGKEDYKLVCVDSVRLQITDDGETMIQEARIFFFQKD